jgi:predicted dehydrogenase
MKAALLAKQKNLVVVGGFCWRYAEGMRAAFDKLHEGAIGNVTTVHSTYHSNTLGQKPRQPGWSDMEWQLRNWWHFTWISGDHLVEQACHSVDRLSWAMGDAVPVRCTALGGRAARKGPESGNVFDHFTVIYEYQDGHRAFLTCRQIDNCPGDNSDYIYASNGSAVLNGFTPLYDLKDPSGKLVWRFEGESKDMYQNEHDALFASIRAGKPMNDGTQMCHSTLMAIMGRMAAYTGQTITWEQALNSQEDLTPAKLEMGPIDTPPIAVPGQTKFS